MKLYPHQIEALKDTEGFQNVAYFYDMGLGKTYLGSEAMIRYGCMNNLIVCQKSKIQDWIQHFIDNYPDYHVLDLTCKQSLMAFNSWSNANMKVVGVINYEMAWRRKDLLKLKNFTLMLDESSLIQNTSAKQTKFILKMNPSHVILLSGTPVGGKYENLWSQVHLLGWDISHKLYDKQYVNWETLTIGGSRKFVKTVNKDDPYKNVERLKQKMREHGAVFKKTEEVIDLPDQVFTEVRVQKPKEYRRFMKYRIITIEDHELIGDTSLTKLLYSRQICSQYNSHKLEAFRNLIESTNDRLIVFYSFNDELDKLKNICQELNRPTSEVNGHVKDLTAYEQENNSVTFCQYQSASKGLNLQKANKIIYFSLPLSSENFEQSKKRIHRIGQDQTCFYWIMITNGTVEEKILQTLKSKKDFTDELFRQSDNDYQNG